MASHKHPFVLLKNGEREIEIDEEIAPLIAALWERDLQTAWCCQNTKLKTGYIAIAFTRATDAERFLDLVGRFEPLCVRMEPGLEVLEPWQTLYRRMFFVAGEERQSRPTIWSYRADINDLGNLGEMRPRSEWHRNSPINPFYTGQPVRTVIGITVFIPRDDLPEIHVRLGLPPIAIAL